MSLIFLQISGDLGIQWALVFIAIASNYHLKDKQPQILYI